MRGIPKLITTIGLLAVALLPAIAAVPPDPASTPRDARMPVAIAQPLGALKSGPMVRAVPGGETTAMLPEPGMLVLVGSALLGLAALVRKTT